MIACYIGLVFFTITLFIAVVSGATSIPRWACIFNALPLMLILGLFRIGGAGNWCSAIMFTGLLFLI